MVNSLMRSVWREGLEWYRSILEAIPGETGCKIRNALYGYRAQSGCRVLRGVIIYSPAKLVLGRNVGISPHTQLNAAGGIEIGDDTLIGPGCMIWSVNHRFEDLDAAIRCQGYEPAKITIERDCWIAAGSVVLPGVRIGAGSVVAAGSVVTHSCEPGSIVAGVPAQLVRKRGR
jgi:acetyltransferase-like isoleucine patch superfamily enzyme